jgi:hypothetical protein
MVANLVEIFYYVDEFCKEFEKTIGGTSCQKTRLKRDETGLLRCLTVK